RGSRSPSSRMHAAASISTARWPRPIGVFAIAVFRSSAWRPCCEDLEIVMVEKRGKPLGGSDRPPDDPLLWPFAAARLAMGARFWGAGHDTPEKERRPQPVATRE